MLSRVTTVVILLAVFIQYVEGFERGIVVAEYDNLISDEDMRAIGSGNDLNFFDNLCCIYGNCSCPSLYTALANLTSNILINIITDVELLSIIPLIGLVNISIIGHNNSTINCHNSGGLQLISCYNCTIEGITWEQCGAKIINDHDKTIYPVLQLCNSSNIEIKDCLFHHSTGQAILLSGVSGHVNINYCNFLSNKQYKGHGTAVHYSSNMLSSSLNLIINNCNFSYNKRAKSVVYFGQSSNGSSGYLYLQNSQFHNKERRRNFYQ